MFASVQHDVCHLAQGKVSGSIIANDKEEECSAVPISQVMRHSTLLCSSHCSSNTKHIKTFFTSMLCFFGIGIGVLQGIGQQQRSCFVLAS